MADRTFRDNLQITVTVLVALLVLVLILQNQETAVTEVYFWTLEMPRFVLLAAVFLVGGLAGYLLGRGVRMGRKHE
jgi:uncharacterized integral membrane protein